MLNRALRLLRTYHQLSQQELAAKLGISNTYLSEIEKGSKSASVDLLEKYSQVFRMPTSSIMLFAETLDSERKPGTKLRVAAADKILKLLEWIEDREVVSQTS
jgi:transcriptional regulator with XRE-family HTH domain